MPVETRYVVLRNNVEVETFMDKKSADEYDKMLDMADGLSALLEASPVTLSDEDTEKLSIYLAKEREALLIALQAKKAKVSKPPKAETAEGEPVELKEVS